MNFRSIKTIAPALCLLPALIFAEDAPNKEKEGESFQEICTASWMKRVDEISDKVGYKNFGEKYCACALTQPLDTDAAVDKAIKTCISRTLLHNAMDTLEDKIGLSKAKDSDINQYCLNEWNLIYPKITDEVKQTAAAFCTCAEPKLASLVKDTDKVTDKDYATQIDTIAESCSATIKPDTSTNKSTD
ncbi:MAG: hypothetical protein WC785_05750 [Tatlockia sp.]|jgi:hypothetical protein